MNNKVDEKPDVKATEEANGGTGGETDADVAAETGPQDPGAGLEAADAPGAGQGPSTDRPWLLILSLIVLLAATAGAAGYLYFDISEGRKADAAQLQSLADGMDALRQSHASLAENTRLLDERLTGVDEQFTGMLRDLNKLYRQRDSDTGWQLAELKYLFQVASHRLALARDVDTAQAILLSADARLREVADPALIPVRERLIADIERLQAARDTDYTGLALMLANLAERSDRFPLNYGATGAQPAQANDDGQVATGNKWQQLARSLWQELKSLVVISRTDDNTAALLAPPERYFLYQNLRLQLETGRMALLLRDEDQYRLSLAACKEWLNEYFDTGDARVHNALASLDNAQAVDFYASVPSIDGTLKAFDEYLAAGGALQ